MKNKDHVIIVDDVSAEWLRVKAEAAHKSIGQIIKEIVHKEIADPV
jgi:hypothetical protein